MKYDCVIVLGGSTDKNIFRGRVDKAIDFYLNKKAPCIVLSGKGWGGKEIENGTSEAESMRIYAEKRGIPSQDIITETASKDTIGNAFFLKRDVVLPRKFKDFLIVSWDYHKPRTEYIFKKIFGTDYNFKVVTVPPEGISVEQLKRNKAIEKDVLEKTERFFEEHMIDPKNMAQMEKLLLTKHPYYKNARTA